MVSAIQNLKIALKFQFEKEPTGHDWFHLERVWRVSRKIARSFNNIDLFKLDLIALLHDVDDWKFTKSKTQSNAIHLLKALSVESNLSREVLKEIGLISFKGSGKTVPESQEGKIVQDADRLDALGAIGIARAFAYGGFKGRQIYAPKIKPIKSPSGRLATRTQTTINHFYEKLLLLKDKMNTSEGRKMARARHSFLKKYLNQFLAEWKGVI